MASHGTIKTHGMAQKQGGDSNQCKRLHGIIITGEVSEKHIVAYRACGPSLQ